MVILAFSQLWRQEVCSRYKLLFTSKIYIKVIFSSLLLLTGLYIVVISHITPIIQILRQYYV